MTRLTTNPDCASRLSTLHSAHLPVRGQPPPIGALVIATAGRDAVTPLNAVAVEEAVPALSEEDRVHAARTAEASRTRPGRIFIESKDRAGDQAPRLLNSLRSGQFVRFYGMYLNNSQVQLRQFN